MASSAVAGYAGRTAAQWDAVDAAILAGSEAAFAFLEALIAAPSTVGAERRAQGIVAAELDRLGFGVSFLPVPAQTAAGAPGGARAT